MKPTPGRSYRPILLSILAGLVAVAAAVLIIVLVTNGDDTPGPITGLGSCDDYHGRPQLVAYFNGDSADTEMQAAATALRGRETVAALSTATRQQSFEHFKVIFKDQPELVRLTRPESLPASIWILLAPNVQTDDLASRLRTEFPAADISTDACTLPPRTTR